jgi:hypothetical protein
MMTAQAEIAFVLGRNRPLAPSILIASIGEHHSAELIAKRAAACRATWAAKPAASCGGGQTLALLAALPALPLVLEPAL